MWTYAHFVAHKVLFYQEYNRGLKLTCPGSEHYRPMELVVATQWVRTGDGSSPT